MASAPDTEGPTAVSLSSAPAAVWSDALPERAGLPAFLTPIVGRERELAAIRDLLRGDGVRLLTLTGSGGIGKTRLAVCVAEAMTGEFADGAAFVPLASVSESDLVPAAIAQAFGVLKDGDGPLLGRVRRFLDGKRLLLVLDNFEHVIAAAPVVGDLLSASRSLKVLATSQASLRISGEQEFQVSPLSMPDAGRQSAVELAGSDAVALFSQRARAARSDFVINDHNAPAVAEICRRLDGLPLAIELAAARVKVLSPQALVSRMEHRLQVLTGGPRDQPSRLQTIRAAVTWSHDLLTDDEQRVFRRLSVCAGGFTLDAAEAVCGEAAGTTDLSPSSVLDLLTSLVDKCLVQRLGEGDESTARFSMFETIREYAGEQLAASGEADGVCRRHAEFYAALAEQYHSDFYGAGELHRKDALADEQPNLRAAIETSIVRGWGDVAGQIAGALSPFWFVHGHAEEGRRWLAAALAQPAAGDDALRARALFGAGILAWQQRDYDAADALHMESLAISRANADVGGTGRALFGLADVAVTRGEHREASARFEQALEIFRDLDERVWIAFTLTQLAAVSRRLGDWDRASSLLEEVFRLGPSIGTRLPIAEALRHDGELAWNQGDPLRATAQFQQSARVYWQLGERLFVVSVLQLLGCVSVERGLLTAAATLLGAVDAALESRSFPRPVMLADDYRNRVAALRGRLGEAAFAVAWTGGRAMTLSEAVAFATGPVLTGDADERPLRRSSPPESVVTFREHEVLRLLAAGLSDRQIADALFISPRTAQVHVARILSKLGVNSRTAAVTAAIRAGLVDPGDVS